MKTKAKPNAEKPTSKKPTKSGAGFYKKLHAEARKSSKTFEPDPKDANTVNAIRAKLEQMRQYKRILAEDGLMPDQDDKEFESELIKQLIRIEKGLSPKKAPKGKKSKSADEADELRESEGDMMRETLKTAAKEFRGKAKPTTRNLREKPKTPTKNFVDKQKPKSRGRA